MKVSKHNAGSSAHFAVFMGAIAWQVIFLYVPLVCILLFSFFVRDNVGLTLAHYHTVSHWFYLVIIFRSLLLAFITAVMCLLLAYPICYYIASKKSWIKNILLFLVIVPFWTSLMVQVYSWFFVLERYGLLNILLLKIGVINQPLQLLNSMFAIYVVMVYCYLPFMIFPLYAALEKIDPGLLEASADLGASGWQSFVRVTLPLSMQGIKTGFFLVFIPSFGELVIPTLLGGGKYLFVGQLIAHYFIGARDPHTGAAFILLAGVFLLLAVMSIYWYFQRSVKLIKA